MKGVEYHQQTVAHKVIRNTAYNIVGRAWSSLVAIFMTPYILHRIGVDRYGIFSLLAVLVGYMALFDFGLGVSFGRFIAEYEALRDERKMCEVIGTGLLFYLFFGVGILCLSVFLVKPFISLLKIPPALHHETVVAFWISIISFALVGMLNAFSSAATGLQRMDISNKISVGMSIVTAAATVGAIRGGYGLLGIVAVNAVCALGAGCVNVAVAFRLIPALRRYGMAFNAAMFRRLFEYGWKIQISRFSGLVASQIGKILIGIYLSIALVTSYQIGSGLIMYAASIASLLAAALMPAFTEIMVRHGKHALVGAYLRSSRYLALIIAPLFLFIMASAPFVVTAWLGHPLADAAPVTAVLAFAWMVNAIAQAAVMVCSAVNRPGIMARGSILIVVLTIAGVAVGVRHFGIIGAAWGNAAGVAAGTLFFIIEVNGVIGVTLRTFARAVVPSIACSLAAAAALAVLDHLFFSAFVSASRGAVFSLLCGRAGFFLCLYAALLGGARLVTGDDIHYFRDRISSLLQGGRERI